MKKELDIVNTYINTASKGIKDKRIKSELKDELYSHLIEIYERNIALGMNDEEAQKDAVSHMGDSETVALTFKKLYPVSSEEYFKQTGWMFAWIFIFSMLWMHRGVDALFVLSIYLFATLQRIKDINSTIHKAYNIAKVTNIFYLLFTIVNNNIILKTEISITICIIFNLLIIISYGFTIFGLVRVRKDLKEEKTYTGLAFASLFAIIIRFVTINIQLYIKEDILLVLLSTAIGLLPAGFMYTISAEDIDRLGTGVPKAKKVKLTRYFIVIPIAILCLSLLFTANFFTYYSPIDYTIDDTQNYVEGIKSHLVELGLPQSIADELPESELLKYNGATQLEIEELPEDWYSDSYYTSYNFTLKKDDNSFIVRTLMYVENFEDFKERNYTELFIDCYRYETKDIFCKFLCDYEDITKELLPIKSEPIKNSDYEHFQYVFPNTKDATNHRVYIAMTLYLTPTTEDYSYYLRHRYAQTRLDEINDPYDAYWSRDDDWFSNSIANPYYSPAQQNSDYPIIEYPTNVYYDDELVDFNDYY